MMKEAKGMFYPMAVTTLMALCIGCATMPPSSGPHKLYRNDFEHVGTGKVPEDFFVLRGKFSVIQDGTNRVLELPGQPLGTFGLLFGPAATDGLSTRARIRATARKRLYPKMGLGLNGAGGYILWLVPVTNTLELTRGKTRRAKAPLPWISGTWVTLQLQVNKLGENHWQIQGKAWGGEDPEPPAWTIVIEDRETPPSGRPSLWGVPYADTPIQFDDVTVEPAGGKQ